MVLRALVAIAIVLGSVPPPLAAQCPAAPRLGSLYGASFDRVDWGAGRDIAFGFRWSRLGSKPGGDVAVRLFPTALRAGVLFLGADLGAAHAIRLGRARLLIRAGTSNIVAGGLDAHALVLGLQAGIGILIPVDPRSAVRLDLSRHRYFSDDIAPTAWTLGLGFAVLPSVAGSGGR